MRTLIKNGTVVTASDTNKTDVLIDGEKVAAIGSGLATSADQVIDAENRYVMPGSIDVHTHMELPFGGTFASDEPAERPARPGLPHAGTQRTAALRFEQSAGERPANQSRGARVYRI